MRQGQSFSLADTMDCVVNILYQIFTRAEHKRRHELNHNPDASYRCSQQGCGKSFHRLDLLQRHQERQYVRTDHTDVSELIHCSELEASTQPASPIGRRYPSQTNVLSEAPTAIPITSMASPQIPQPPPRTSAGGMSIPSLMNHPAYHHDHTAYGMNPYMQLFSAAEGWDPIYATDGTHPAHSRAYHRSSVSATSSVAGFDPSSQSPMVTASMPQATWASAPPPTVLPANMFEEGMSPYPPVSASVWFAPNCY